MAAIALHVLPPVLTVVEESKGTVVEESKGTVVEESKGIAEEIWRTAVEEQALCRTAPLKEVVTLRRTARLTEGVVRHRIAP